MYVCMYECMYVYVYVCMHLSMHIMYVVNRAFLFCFSILENEISQKLTKVSDIEVEFANMTEEIQETLQRKQVDVSSLIKRLRTQSAVRMRNVPLFDEKVFKKVKTISELWERLSNFWTIFDYEILLLVIRLSKCNEAKKAIDNFLAKIDPSAFEDEDLVLRCKVYKEEDFVRPLLRVKIKADNCNIELTKKVKDIISTKFNLEDFSLQFVGIKEGCIEIIFCISTATMSYLLKCKFTESIMSDLAKWNIVTVHINEVKVNIPSKLADMVSSMYSFTSD